jgi:hypothetical protein
MRIQFKRLPEGHPDRRAVAFGHSLAPEHQNIDPLIGNAGRPQWPSDPPRRMLRNPRLHPWPDAMLKAQYNLIGDPLVKIFLHWLSPSKPGCALLQPD